VPRLGARHVHGERGAARDRRSGADGGDDPSHSHVISVPDVTGVTKAATRGSYSGAVTSTRLPSGSATIAPYRPRR
jgi:hypothetical protein